MPGSGSAGAIPADAMSLLAMLQGGQGAGTIGKSQAAIGGAAGLASTIAGASPYGAAADLAGKALSASGDSGPTSATSGSDGSQKVKNTGTFGDFIVNKGSGSVSASPKWYVYAAGAAVLLVGIYLLKKA